MKFRRVFAATALIAAFFALELPSAFGQSTDPVLTRTTITVLPKSAEQIPAIEPQNVKIQVNGKSVPAESVTPLRGDQAGLELVVLIDTGARNSLGRQMSEIATFVKSLPPSTQVAIAYMVNGRADFQQPFTSDKALALRALHLPGGVPGNSASPYFCISDLAKHWPSRNPQNRREVLAITDGIDPYEVRFDPEDPYVLEATHDAIRAGVVVDALYWHDAGFASRNDFLVTGGQSLLGMITADTGGTFYYQGFSNPVSFAPYLNDLSKRLENQYELGFTAPTSTKPAIGILKVKLEMPNVKLDAPHLVSLPAARQ